MYSAYDKQNNIYFNTGKNSKTYKECFKDIKEFLLSDNQLKNDWANESDKEILCFFEVEIHKHKDKI